MTNLKTITTAALFTAGLLTASPSAAAVTTFATFSAIGNNALVWKNNDGGGTSSTYRAGGTGGSFYTTSSAPSVIPDQAIPGAIPTHFSFLQPALASVSNVNALFGLYAAVTWHPATAFGGFDFQEGLSGSFSFLSTGPLTVGSTVYAAGSNLLSATFDQLTIFGQNLSTSAGAVSSTGSGATITYTSDFLNFTPTVNRDISLSLFELVSRLGGVNKGVNFTSGHALRSFRALPSGSFSSDPAPLTNTVPEPQVWALLVAGFGLVGVQVRRRRGMAALAS